MLPKRRQRKKLNSEINVVPYIDVVLVLLVIFMITAPMLSQGVNVNLPQATVKNIPPHQQEPIIVSIDRAGLFYLNISKQPTQNINAQDLMSEVSSALQQAEQAHQQREVYVKGDTAVDYGKVMQAMVLLQKAGASNVGLITQPPPEENGK